MLSGDEILARRETIAESADLQALADRLSARADQSLERGLTIPAQKALLSADGGHCPDDGSALDFDPWSPDAHRCPRCRRSFQGERHSRAWARFQHLWIAERAAELAALAALQDRDDAGAGVSEILASYAQRYESFPNRDNVLGPSRLFFSTYLESIWITNYLAAATLLRESGRLDDQLADAVGRVADEAANLIGEFDEGFSNRQTWHNAALAAIGVWFGDEELAARAIEAPTGILAHLDRGFGSDGMWYEGENYHLFALRGELAAIFWARLAGADILAEPALAAHLEAALRAPAITALPDHTFPARKDSRFAVSLAQPMYLELWELGLAALGDQRSDLWSWLRELYQAPAPRAERFDSYLHEAGDPEPAAGDAPSRRRSRADLSWWALLQMAPQLPSDIPAWAPGDALLEGLAILRRGDRYASLECGAYGGGHGHPDRLHLTLFADGQHWLADPGTGSYVSRDLFWYRSTLAHNAPRLDGVSQPPGDATCTAFDQQGAWAWARGVYGSLTRTLVAGPEYLIDCVDLSAAEEHLLELPWHVGGPSSILTAGTWQAAPLDDAFVSQVERFTTATDEGILLRARADQGPATLTLNLPAGAELLRGCCPGRPGSTTPATFYLVRARGRGARLITVLESSGGESESRDVNRVGEAIEVVSKAGAGKDRHLDTGDAWEIETAAGRVVLRGSRRPAAASRPLINLDRPVKLQAIAAHFPSPPALDGTLDDFGAAAPILLDYEDQYRRSEEPYGGPEAFSAAVYLGWDAEALYLAADVTKNDLVFRPTGAPPLRLDNEPDDIHSDGIQVYFRPADGPVYGFLIVPADESGRIRAHGVNGTAGAPEQVRGSWQRTEGGYALTAALSVPEWQPRSGDEVDFDILVNRMEPNRLRRAGQLVWTGGGGWVYLRGDRQSLSAFGILQLG